MRRPPSSCDCSHCLLLYDCILVLLRLGPVDIALYLYISLHSTPAALPVVLRTVQAPYSTPRCALSSSRPTWTFDDGARASRSTLRSFAGDSPSTTPSSGTTSAYVVSEDSCCDHLFPRQILHILFDLFWPSYCSSAILFQRDGTPKGFVGMGQKPSAQSFQAWKTPF